MSSNLVII